MKKIIFDTKHRIKSTSSVSGMKSTTHIVCHITICNIKGKGPIVVKVLLMKRLTHNRTSCQWSFPVKQVYSVYCVTNISLYSLLIVNIM